MTISQQGIELIKKFEGCRLQAYKPVSTEKYWTIGYGHYGPDVKEREVITQAQAESLLVVDLQRFEKAVINTGLELNQNQFDALVSFAYNCGEGNLRKLVSGRTTQSISAKLLLYNKAGGRALPGLTRRRQEEYNLFTKDIPQIVNVYSVPNQVIKLGSRGEGVKWVQTQLNKAGYGLTVDGIVGHRTVGAIRHFQMNNDLVMDGIVGKKTIEKLKVL